MANKNTNMILAVAVIAVCAIAIIGVGYAYTATTENTGNDSSVKYITLTQGNDPTKYTGAFDREITYDTVTKVDTTTEPDTVKTTYTLTDGQAEQQFAIENVKAVKLGAVNITVKKTNTTEDYIFSVTDNSAASTEDDIKMDGTFYIGIKVNNAEKVRVYTPGAINYYMTGNTTTAATEKNSATPIDKNVSADATIVVSMYVAVNESTPATAAPLEKVTFTFEATAPGTTA